MRIFLARRRNRLATDVFYAIFSSAMFLMATIWVFTTSLFGLNMWLLDRTYAGGPSRFMTGPPSLVTRCIMLAVSVIVQQMADGLMVRLTRRIKFSVNLTRSDPGVPLPTRMGQRSCHHHTLLPVVRHSQ